MALKNFTQGMKFPRDFWNYAVNPITGFSIYGKVQNEGEDLKQYEMTPNRNVNHSDSNNFSQY